MQHDQTLTHIATAAARIQPCSLREVTKHCSYDGAAEVLTLLAVRGYPGYVDAVIVHWLALPEDQRDQVSVDMIADMAAGAFSRGFPALA